MPLKKKKKKKKDLSVSLKKCIVQDMYQWLAEEGTGGCLCMFFSPLVPSTGQ